MRKTIKGLLIFVAASLVLCQQTTAQQSVTPKHYICYRTEEQLTIDGLDNEQSWQNAAWTDNFVDIEGNSKPLPQYQTKAKMLWDKEYLYVFAQLEEPHVWANITQRDAVIFQDNDFEVFVDPDGDTHGYFEFEINALNTVWDLLLPKPYRDGGPAINDWNFTGLKTAIAVQGTINHPADKDKGWNIEIAFPLKSFMIYCATGMPKDGDTWRINFSRVEWKIKTENGTYRKEVDPSTGRLYAEDNWVWSPQGVVNMHLPENWGYLQFTTSVDSKKNIPFRLSPDEAVKSELRKIYYAQKKYISQNKRYASSPDELKELSTDAQYHVDIKTTRSLFEATAFVDSSQWLWHIDQSGRTWKTPVEN